MSDVTIQVVEGRVVIQPFGAEALVPFLNAAADQATLAGEYANNNTDADIPGAPSGERGALYWVGRANAVANASTDADIPGFAPGIRSALWWAGRSAAIANADTDADVSGFSAGQRGAKYWAGKAQTDGAAQVTLATAQAAKAQNEAYLASNPFADTTALNSYSHAALAVGDSTIIPGDGRYAVASLSPTVWTRTGDTDGKKSANEAANSLASSTAAATSAGLISAGHMATSKPVNGTTLGAVASFGSSSGTVTRAYWDGIMWRKFSDATYLAFYQVATVNVDGDSIGRGVNASPVTNGWANSIASTMAATLSNRSVDGTVLSNYEGLANNLRDTFQTDLLGTNLKASAIICRTFNEPRRPTASVSVYGAQLREIITRCLMADAYNYQSLILAEPYYITDTGLVTGSGGFSGNSRATFETYVAQVTTAAQEWGLPLIPFYNYLKNNSTDRTAWIADVDGNDKIHPTNTGHSLLATIARTQTYVANTLPRVTNLSFISSASGSFTVQWDRQQSADSYKVEYGLFSNLNFSTGSTTAAQAGTATISKTVTSLAEGVYIARVCGVYGGVDGPWALTRSAYAVAGSLVETVNGLTGSLAGANGTTLASVTPTTGTWTQHPTSSTTMALNGSSRIRAGSSTTAFTLYTLASQAIPTGGRVYSEADTFNGAGFTAGTVLQGVVARLDATNRVCICALYNGSTIRLFFLNGGTSYTQLGIYTPSATLGTYTLRLECGAGTQTVYLDGVPIISTTVADASMPGLGSTQGIMIQTAGFNYSTTSNTGLLFTRVETGYLS